MDLNFAREVLDIEAKAIASLHDRIDEDFGLAVQMILSCKGRVVVSGIGKAGLIGNKISATLASTGTPSLFLHPADAAHGDLGRVVREDILLALSNSGATTEVLDLIPIIKQMGARIISITARRDSPLGKLSDLVLDIGDIEEACPMGLAPSASTTALLAMGDALALTVLKERGLDPEKFAMFHPAGELGRKLLKVQDIMRTGAKNPSVPANRTVQEVLMEITRARSGAVTIVDEQGKLLGIFTDGDLRRHLSQGLDIKTTSIKTWMTPHPVTIRPEQLAVEAIPLLKEKQIDELPVVDNHGRPVGMLDIQDLLAVGLL